MYRFIRTSLQKWKSSRNRKPLILKGARQVGKTFELLAFAKAEYQVHHYFNFEKEPKLKSIFSETLDPVYILQALALHRNTQINSKTDLIIFDEIQACPDALTSLKYFYEDLPEVSLCAAGSLLGIYLNQVSYPVGKVDHLEMYPMSFQEFLLASGHEIYVKLLQELTQKSVIPKTAHDFLWDQLKRYFITGGLPEVVSIYCDNKEQLVTAFNLVREKQKNLIEDYFSDIAKHSGKINAMHINRVWRSIPEQLARAQDSSARKFKFKGVIPGIDRYAKIADALDWLESAGLLLKVKIINKAALPFNAYAKENAFKLFLFDVGLLGAMGEITPKVIMDYDYGSYKGFFAENFVAQAFTFSLRTGLYSWTEGASEIEFMTEVDSKIIPVEVKSGWVTQAKSLKMFSEKYQPSYCVIFSAKNLNIDSKSKTHYLPLYLAQSFPFDGS